MDTLTQQIIDMLNQGISWKKIEKNLNVYPNKISEVKKLYPGMIKISKSTANSDNSTNSNSAITNSGSATAIDGGIKSDEIEACFSNPRKNSVNNTIDPTTLKEMKKMQYDHEQILKKMEYEDKERDRALIRENRERELKEKRDEEGNETTIKKLQEENWELRKNSARPQEVQKIEKLEEPHEDETDDPEYWDDIMNFVTGLLKKDGKIWKTDKIETVLCDTSDLKERFRKICEADGTEVTDFIDWDLLTTIEIGFKRTLENIKNKKLSNNTQITFIAKTKKLLNGFLKK